MRLAYYKSATIEKCNKSELMFKANNRFRLLPFMPKLLIKQLSWHVKTEQ